MALFLSRYCRKAIHASIVIEHFLYCEANREDKE
jgi:hypothetical protein